MAILALGLFVKLTTELAPSPSLLRTHYAASLVSLSLCLRVSVLIRHFVDTGIPACDCVYIYVHVRVKIYGVNIST